MKSSILNLFGSKNKLKKVFLGNGAFILEVPSKLIVEKDEEGTVIIYEKNSNDAIIRISFISFKPNDPNETDGGLKIVINTIKEKKYESFKIGKRLIAHWEEQSKDNEKDLILKYWEFGYENNLIILSVTITKDQLNSENVKRIVEMIPSFLGSFQSTQSRGSIKTTEGQIEYTSSQVEGSCQHTELNDEDKKSIKEYEKLGINVLNKYIGANNVSIVSFKELDMAFKTWLNDNDESRTPDNDIGNGLGIIFGIKLVESLGMEWKKVTDEYGTDFAVLHQNNNTMAFPVSSVFKRIESKESDFFCNISQVIKNRIDA
ncbi:MAG: DUF3806 domain-containing protein [bacterium]|nr:DUF3806 domain-containing protein [bacterium]